jgi:hypothetical protein
MAKREDNFNNISKTLIKLGTLAPSSNTALTVTLLPSLATPVATPTFAAAKASFVALSKTIVDPTGEADRNIALTSLSIYQLEDVLGIPHS